MMTNPQNADPYATLTPKKERGCLFYGCSGGLILIAGVILAGLLLYQQLSRNFNQPPHAPLMLTAAEEAELRELRGLLVAEEGGQRNLPQGGLRLSSRQLAGLLELENPELENMVRFNLAPNLFGAELRLPMNENQPGNRKHFVLRFAFHVMQTGDRVEVRLRDARFGPIRLPGFMMRELENEDLLAEFFDDPENRQNFQNLVERIEIQQDAILFVPRLQP